MSFRANVLKVMIASPGDVGEERKIVTEEIYRWNDANASARQLILLPVKWETHSTPQMGGHPQEIINRQLLEDADIVIGIFGTRIGTPTEEFVSGTVEEIKKHVAAGKTAKIYFSDVPIPPSELNAAQYASVLAFREECKSIGLYATFKSTQEFGREFSQHLSLELNQARFRWLAAPEESDSATQEQKITLSDDEVRLLRTAAKEDGEIICIDNLEGLGMRVGEEEFSDGTPRSGAKWRSVLRKLMGIGAVEYFSGDIYRVTEIGYEIEAQAEAADHAPKLTAFDEHLGKHTRKLLESVNYMQRDLMRLLLLQGGTARSDVISASVANAPGGINFNALTQPLILKGLMARVDDHNDGHTTFFINSTMGEALKHLLFPRTEENGTPFFNGIPS
jgi:hypothetical protein